MILNMQQQNRPGSLKNISLHSQPGSQQLNPSTSNPKIGTVNSVQSQQFGNMIQTERINATDKQAVSNTSNYTEQSESDFKEYQMNLVKSYQQIYPQVKKDGTPKKSALKKPPQPHQKAAPNSEFVDPSYFNTLQSMGLSIDVTCVLPIDMQGQEGFLLIGFVQDRNVSIVLSLNSHTGQREIMFEHPSMILHAILTKNPHAPNGHRNIFVVDIRGCVFMYSNLRGDKYEISKPFGNQAQVKYYSTEWVEGTGRILSLFETYVYYVAANSPNTENWLVRLDSQNLIESVIAFKGTQGQMQVQQVTVRDGILYALATDALYKFKFENNTAKMVGCAKFQALCTAFEVFNDHRVVVCSQNKFAR